MRNSVKERGGWGDSYGLQGVKILRAAYIRMEMTYEWILAERTAKLGNSFY